MYCHVLRHVPVPQVEKKVKGMVEDALLSQGLDAYKAYKYSEG